jgi:capsular polysaccharide biosynthesis protein
VNTEAAMVRRAAVASLLVAVAVCVASLFQTPKYEASARLLVDQKLGDQQQNLAGSGEEIQTEGLPRIRIDIPEDQERLQQLTPMLPYAIDSRPVAQEAIQRLGLRMEPAELLNNLTPEQVENTSSNTSFIRLRYKGTDPVQAKQIVNTVAKVSSERISEAQAAGSKLRATVDEEVAVPTTPVSPKPLRNGLLALVVGLALSVGLMGGRGVLRP